jgi:hypothetical protein
MLKRNGEPIQYSVPGFSGKLTRGEFDAYNEAFDQIKAEFAALQRVKSLLDDLNKDPVVFTIPDKRDGEHIDARDAELGEIRWVVRSCLLKLNLCEVLLCDRPTTHGKEFAVVQKLRSDSPYARANGSAEVLLTGNDAPLLVQNYGANAEHTLKFMASNMVAVAHKVIWERFANQNPSRVVQAISERCAQAVSNVHGESQAHAFQSREERKQARGIRV